MKASNYRFLIIAASMTFIVGTIFVYSEFIRGAYTDIQVLRAKRDGALKKLAETREAISSIQQLTQRYESLAQLKDNFSLMLPEEDDIPTAINQLETLAAQETVTIASLTVEYVHPKKDPLRTSILRPFHTVRIDMRLVGSYDNVKEFLKAVQTNTRIMDVVSFKINGNGASKDTLEYSVVVQTYYQE